MPTSNNGLKPEEHQLLKDLQQLLEKTSKDFESTLGDTRKASSVRIAGLTQKVDVLEKDFNALKSTFYAFRDLITRDDQLKEEPTSISTKVRVLWRWYNAEKEAKAEAERIAKANKAKWTGRDWIDIVKNIGVGVALAYLAYKTA